MESIVFYGFCLLMIIIGFALFKKIVGCMLRTVITLIIIAVIALAYYYCGSPA